MARQDIANMLTGMGGNSNKPNPNMSSADWRMAFGAQQAGAVNRAASGVSQGMFGSAPMTTPQESIAIGMGNLDLGTIGGLQTLGQMQQMRNDTAGAAKTASQIKAMQEKKQKANAIADVVLKEFPERQDLVDLAKTGNFTLQDLTLFRKDPKAYEPLYLTSQQLGSTTNVNIVNGKVLLPNGQEVTPESLSKNNMSITKTFVKRPVKEGDINVTTGEKQGDKLDLELFKSDLKSTGEFRDKAQKSYDQYAPIIDNMISGTGSAAFASANNLIMSLSKKLGFEVIGTVGENDASATLFFNANSKLLKQRLLEATKGAISNLENTEITKNTANSDMPEQVSLALLNSNQAGLYSGKEKANAQYLSLVKNKNIVGFNEAWELYTEMFPRTAGYHSETITNLDGTTSAKVVDNFEMVEGNFDLFEELYSDKLTAAERRAPVSLIAVSGATTTLTAQKELFKKAIVDRILNDAGLGGTKPSSAVLLNADRKVRKTFGTYVKNKLNTQQFKVVR